jgi:taurine dioxygenase
VATAVQIEPSGLGFAARVTGVDLAAGVTPEELAEIRDAWLDHEVLVFPDQHLDSDQQIAFGRKFGELAPVRLGPKTDEPIYVLYVATTVEEGQRQAVDPNGELTFHMDQSYLPAPNRATILYGITIAPDGGDTLFASATLAYERLDPALAARVGHLSAFHQSSRGGTAGHVHPLVVEHPDTKKPVLYVNRLITKSVEGLPEAEGQALLEQLWAHLEDDKYIYRHRWQPNDLVLWDNRAVLHARTDFTGERALRRVTIQGEELAAASS